MILFQFIKDNLGSFSGLLTNASLMLLLCVVYDTFGIYSISNKKIRDACTGVLVGLIGIAVMLNPWSLQPGVFFDTRWVLLSLCGLFFGFSPTVIAVVITGSFRLYQGGPGGVVGTVVIVVTACVGVGWRFWRDNSTASLDWKELYAFGILVQLAMLSCMTIMPTSMIVPIVKAVAPPILIIFPLLTVVIGLILKRQEVRRNTEKELVENRKALIKERGLLRGVINSISDLIFFKDIEGVYLGCNKAFESVLGFEEQELLGKTDIEGDKSAVFKEQDHEVITSGNPVKIERWVELQQGGKMLMKIVKTPFKGLDGTLHGLVGISHDITERRKVEEEREKLQGQLIQAQKMESIGRLAGGVAHDFNNMLGVILGYAEMAMDDLEPTDQMHKNLHEIRKAADRSVNLTRQLLAFARKQTISPKVLDLNETVGGMIRMLKRLIGEDISLVWYPAMDLNHVKIDPIQIDQILANLCVNARDAIEDTGKITIETAEASFNETYCRMHQECIPGDYILLAVSDDGCGMNKETLSRLYEPFFTTKEVNKGTGLGLSTVYGIVKQNNGFINVYSEPGEGTTFKIYFPQHVGKADQIVKDEKTARIKNGNETILLTEDEPMILNMATAMLENQGYNVLPAATPEKALRLSKEHSGEIHLLMTDVVMPKMNGRDLAKNLLFHHPKLKVLFMSGYTANVIAHHGVLEEGVNFIQKPFSAEAVAAKIREALA